MTIEFSGAVCKNMQYEYLIAVLIYGILVGLCNYYFYFSVPSSGKWHNFYLFNVSCQILMKFLYLSVDLFQ